MGADLPTLLRTGELSVRGRMPWSSNGTFLVDVCAGDEVVQAVYKPLRGERPLWDFPAGIYRREVAAHELARALGWNMVPVTVEVTDGPLGAGSVQAFVDADFEQHYFTLLEDEALHPQLRRICVFDLLANSTDRKSGHCLLDDDGQVWAVDNGLTFHHEFKLRTVIWDFAGEPVPDDLLGDVARFADADLPGPLAELLDPFERDALRTRARAVVEGGRFPVDTSGHRYPWPLV